MKNYLHINDGICLFSVVPSNIGYNKADYEAGKYIELDAKQLEIAERTSDFNLIFPKQYYYIKLGPGVIVLATQLNDKEYKIGSTYNDYLNGMFVPLNDDQEYFYKSHKNATIAAIWNCGKDTPRELTVEDVRSQKLNELAIYDNSTAVNEFLINGIGAWFTPAERTNYSSSVAAAKLLGVETLSFYVSGMKLDVPTASAEQMLAAVMLYADQCFIVTKQHEAAINSLESIEDINNYNFKTGYPEKLVFSI